MSQTSLNDSCSTETDIPGARLCPLKLRPEAPLRLICLPYAGGSAGIFSQWSELLAPVAEVWVAELAGRDSLIHRPAFDQAADLVDALHLAWRERLNIWPEKPVALFGHSMGGMLAFELCRKLRGDASILPALLLISAHRAPHLPDTRNKVHTLDDDDFLQALVELDGTSSEVLEQPELMQLLLPRLRADFTLSETYVYSEQAPLDVPLHVFAGEHDREIEEHEIAAWKRHTNARFKQRVLPGNHFFIHTLQQDLLQMISSDLLALVVESSSHSLSLEQPLSGCESSTR